MRYIIYCIVILYNITSCYAAVIEVDFDQSMGGQCHELFKIYSANKESIDRYDIYKNIYYDNLPSKIKSSDHPKIPKIIHQVWLGDKELPSLYQKYQQEWKDSYPDFEYKLWTEKEIEQLDFDSKDLYKKTSSYVEKSDVLRYAILNKFGGIYVDFDVEPRGNFADLLYKYDFFATLEPAYRQFKVNPSMNGGFMGASANNPILYEAIRILRVNFDHYDDFENSVYRAMFPLGEAFLSQYHKLDHVLVFPVTYT